MSFERVTRTYVDDNGEEVEVTGMDIEKFPDPSDHDFYQEGSFLRCTCHPNTARRMPEGKQLIMEGGRLTFKPVEVS